METVVELSKRAEKDLAKVPRYIVDKLMVWVEQVETLGLRKTRVQPGFHDEPLLGSARGKDRSVFREVTELFIQSTRI